jgi:hypothetical protein
MVRGTELAAIQPGLDRRGLSYAFCVDRFNDWLRSGPQNDLPFVRTAPMEMVRELDDIKR